MIFLKYHFFLRSGKTTFPPHGSKNNFFTLFKNYFFSAQEKQGFSIAVQEIHFMHTTPFFVGFRGFTKTLKKNSDTVYNQRILWGNLEVLKKTSEKWQDAYGYPVLLNQY
jgi:hypothetical protein